VKELTIETLREILDIVKSSRGFVMEQAPGYAQELVRYELISNGFYLAISLAWIVLCTAAFFWSWHKVVKTGEDNFLGVMIIATIASAFAWVPLLASILPGFLKAWTAPKVLIIKKIMKLVK